MVLTTRRSIQTAYDTVIRRIQTLMWYPPQKSSHGSLSSAVLSGFPKIGSLLYSETGAGLL